MHEWIHFYIGDTGSTLWWQMSIRGVLIFLWTLLLVRIAGRRVFGKNTGFDIVLGVILGSILSRALTGNAEFFPTIAAATTITCLHILMANVSFYVRGFGYLIKGSEIRLIKNGELIWKNMRKANVTVRDLKEALRINGSRETFHHIRSAYLERSGDISFISK